MRGERDRVGSGDRGEREEIFSYFLNHFILLVKNYINY